MHSIVIAVRIGRQEAVEEGVVEASFDTGSGQRWAAEDRHVCLTSNENMAAVVLTVDAVVVKSFVAFAVEVVFVAVVALIETEVEAEVAMTVAVVGTGIMASEREDVADRR